MDANDKVMDVLKINDQGSHSYASVKFHDFSMTFP